MRLNRIPGVKNYRSITEGLAEIAKDPKLGAESKKLAEKIAKEATKNGESTYKASEMTVRVGWNNEPRAGAVVSSDKESPADAASQTLSDAMKVVAGETPEPKEKYVSYVKRDGGVIYLPKSTAERYEQRRGGK